MADIKTHLRELSVAVTVGLLNKGISFTVSDLYRSSSFMAYAQRVIDGDITSANNLLEYDCFPDELKDIINNGHKLGVAIYSNPQLIIEQGAKIRWLGNNTQSGNPIDISIGDYLFSLKEESFILKNMGLYELLNVLTGSHYKRGLHVFKSFAPSEYNAWFAYTWSTLVQYLNSQRNWTLRKGNDVSTISLMPQDTIHFSYNNESCELPPNLSTVDAYSDLTTSTLREKVFAKWIKKELSNDCEYIRRKKQCSVTAGQALANVITTNYTPENVFKFFRIYDFTYYYAKTTSSETTILKVPSSSDFSTNIEFKDCKYEVPGSQLNIISTFRNIDTTAELSFRNECRFSHGQFNGTPEAKMYAMRNTSLADLYTPIP